MDLNSKRVPPLFSVYSVLRVFMFCFGCARPADRESADYDKGAGEREETLKFPARNFGGLGSTLTNPISRGRRPRSATPNPL
jgi:hypothetical protein